MKKLSNIFGLLAIVLTNVMCASVAYSYAHMQCVIAHGPLVAVTENIVFVEAIPFLIAIIACVLISWKLRKREMLYMTETEKGEGR